MENPAQTLARLRAAWEEVLRPAMRRALVALVFAVFFGVAHLARIGTLPARAAALAAIGLAFVLVVVLTVLGRRRRGDPRHAVRKTVSKIDPELGGATLRALTLVERAAADDRVGSPALASLHLSRLIGRASNADLVRAAGLVAARWSVLGLALGVITLVAAALDPFRVVEGLDVLASRKGEAPLALNWLDEVDMSSAPPEYLHEPGGVFMPFMQTSAPRGTVITVRGRPLHRGRKLVLTDGRADVPFVDDGTGAIVSRWTLGESTTLFVAARFGDVRIRQLDEQPVTSIADEVPKVTVEGAPRTVKLIEEPSFPIHYEATDDHGLREVDLVLRAGAREERRVLSRPIADAKADRGGYEIKSTDPFFKRTYVPVSITIEARDNDVVSGPKWGKSEVILVILPQVGEAEAKRYAALLEARGALTDLVADRMDQAPPDAATTATHVKHEGEVQDVAIRAVENALSGSYGGLTLRGRIAALARGQVRRLRKALDAEKQAPKAQAHTKLLEETENVLLAFDAGVRALGHRDSRVVARRLADVADDVAAAAASADAGDQGSTKARLDGGVLVLGGGGKQLLKLGDLGRDLGEIVDNNLRRIARARAKNDMFHTELAARDLAARLRKPDPSFSGGGGHGTGRGGVESGAPQGGEGGDPSSASGADDEAAAGEQELDDLTGDHAKEIERVEQALESAASSEEREALREEAKKHAQSIREAIKNLPKSAQDQGSAEGASASGREQAEAMAGALERGQMVESVERGKRSSSHLGEAKRIGEQSGGFFPEQRAGREAGAAKETIDRELAWAEEALQGLAKGAAARAKDQLAERGNSEQKLGDRARELGKKGESGDRSMPQEMLDHLDQAEQKMREAERALKEGDGDRGLKQQRDAQRHLEMAQSQKNDEQEKDTTSDREDGKRLKGKAKIPGKDQHKGPAEFRRRVLEGLGGSGDPLLRDAVKRYAEGLLK